MKRWILNLIGAVLLAAPVTLRPLEDVLGASRRTGASGWLDLSISAGAYLIYWSPVLLGAAVIFYANSRRR